MFVICDQNDTVQDIATRQQNLSRGFKFAGYKLHKKVTVQDIQIGDQFDGKILRPNAAERLKRQTLIENETKIQQRMRKLAIEKLISEGELPEDYK